MEKLDTTSTVRVNQPKAKAKHYCWCVEYFVFLISSAEIMSEKDRG